MPGIGRRSLPAVRLAEGDAYDGWVPRGQKKAASSEIELPQEWGPAPLWAPSLLLHQWSHSVGGVDSTSVISTGASAPTIATPGGAATVDGSTDLAGPRYSTTTTNGSECGWTGANNERRRYGPMFAASIIMRNDVSGRRDFVGLTASSVVLQNTATHCIGFRHDSGGSWQAITGDGSTLTVAATINSPPTTALDVRYNFLFRVRSSDNAIEFWISSGRYRNGDRMTLLAVATSSLPSIDTNLTMLVATRKLSGASLKQLAIGRVAGTRE